MPIFALSAFVVHIWAIFNMFWDYPSWLLRFDLLELLGASAYTLSFALIESIILAIILIAVAYFFQIWLTWEAAIASSLSLLFSSAIFALVLHINEELWGQVRVLALFWLLSLIPLIWLSIRHFAWQKSLGLIAEKLSILIGVYVVFDLFAVAIVIGRNL